jgi:hypothetical protein
LAYRTTLDSIPASVPYLSVEAERIARWRADIGSRGVRIGINWQGNRASPADRGRSLPLALFESISTLPEVRLISLQHGAGTEQIEECRRRFDVHTMPAEFDQGGNAFLDSAALLESLDLVITSDTALAHLAGALGRPTWLALPHVADWRWLEGRADSPWYPSMRLFRQSERGDWDGVFGQMRSQLLDAEAGVVACEGVVDAGAAVFFSRSCSALSRYSCARFSIRVRVILVNGSATLTRVNSPTCS